MPLLATRTLTRARCLRHIYPSISRNLCLLSPPLLPSSAIRYGAIWGLAVGGMIVAIVCTANTIKGLVPPQDWSNAWLSIEELFEKMSTK